MSIVANSAYRTIEKEPRTRGKNEEQDSEGETKDADTTKEGYRTEDNSLAQENEEAENDGFEEPKGRYTTPRKPQSSAKTNLSRCDTGKIAQIAKKKATMRSLRADDPNNPNFIKTLEGHKYRVRTAKSVIDTSPPVGCSTVRNASYRQRLAEYSRIDRENTIMIRHLAEIIRGKGTLDNKPSKHLKLYRNNRAHERQMKLLRITLDNLSLLKRIQSQKPFYSRKEQLAEYEHNEEVMATLSYYPLYWHMDKCRMGPTEVRARDNAALNPRPLCFLSLGNSDEYFGKIVVELYADDCPLTAENFRGLCSGEYGISYKCSTIHRIIQDILWQGGDISGPVGNGKSSLYGGYFKDENFKHKHDKPGKLTMANVGPDTNGSQFIITAKKLPVLDGTNVVFGEVVSGMSVLEKLYKTATPSGKPKKKVFIVDCGEGEGGTEEDGEAAPEDEYDFESEEEEGENDKSVSEPATYLTDEEGDEPKFV